MLLPARPQSQLLVLRNGEVLAGKVARSDDHYVVQLPNGQVRVKNADVEMVCDNLEEAYRRKRAALQAGDVPQHLAFGAVVPASPTLGSRRRRTRRRGPHRSRKPHDRRAATSPQDGQGARRPRTARQRSP